MIRKVAEAIEAQLRDDPFAVLNESELQASLHCELLNEFNERCDLSLASGVIQRRPTALTCGRVYRETKVNPGQAGHEPDLVVLQYRPQTIYPKRNGAPARFERPYSAIIETKIDANPSQILRGDIGAPISCITLAKDIAKWKSGVDADFVCSIVYTAEPKRYHGLNSVITIRRPIRTHRGPVVAGPIDISRCVSAYEQAVNDIAKAFCNQPFSYLREKDFETALFGQIRLRTPVVSGRLHPLRSQWWSEQSELLGRRRRHDLVILGAAAKTLTLEVELKTSHSDRHNWYRTSALRHEFEAMQVLCENRRLDRAIFLMFRFGPDRWREDAELLSSRFPLVEMSCQCSDQ
jgi:hypothetical protein